MSTYRNNVLDYRKVENEACRDRWIEAMACGTPVIAFNQGAVPEVVKDGVTGFIVETVDEAVRAIARLDIINRAAVRANFERRFSVDVMAANASRLCPFRMRFARRAGTTYGPNRKVLSLGTNHLEFGSRARKPYPCHASIFVRTTRHLSPWLHSRCWQ